ncbi:hypothetical protein ABLG96_05225 [Nakamurella sp. A5-74]|uniref:Uncharacterized protein n=1 Tax=Nakamurella sp. A5-74 TaxID=3158264 RepID=A0AAU8DR82_9ACTN
MNPYAPPGRSVPPQRAPQFPARQIPVQPFPAQQFPTQQWPAQQFPVRQASVPYCPLPFTEALRPVQRAPHPALIIAFGVLVAALLITTVLLVRGTSG